MEPMPEPGFNDNMGDNGGEGKFIKFIKNPYVIGVLIILVIGITVTFRKVRNKKKEMWLDE